jgi:hypothetical protein
VDLYLLGFVEVAVVS